MRGILLRVFWRRSWLVGRIIGVKDKAKTWQDFSFFYVRIRKPLLCDELQRG
jgi:hypothetical protein